jgi:magnesium transporter
MPATEKLFEQIEQHMDAVIARSNSVGKELWEELLRAHPADVAHFFSRCDRAIVERLFTELPHTKKRDVFNELSYALKVFCLSFINDEDRRFLLSHLSLAELTDLLDELSDKEQEEYLKLLHKKEREQVLSLLQFDPESAGGIMDTDVLTLVGTLTVEKSIPILQRLQPRRELHQQIYITDDRHKLLGHINLEDLVLKSPKTVLESIVRPNELVINADEDREEIAKKMVHYGLMTAPVTDVEGIFLGVIASDTLVEVIEEEASEDIYRMATLAPIKDSYFDTPFFTLFYQRGSILLILLIVQTLSSLILQYYQETLSGILIYFLTMLVSAGGNASSQSSALAIQGMAAGELGKADMVRFIKREITMAFVIAIGLGLFSFLRVYLIFGDFTGGLAVSCSLAAIVLVAIIFGSMLPWALKRLNLDPAHSAGPLLATLMDVIGLLIYCSISYLILRG